MPKTFERLPLFAALATLFCSAAPSGAQAQDLAACNQFDFTAGASCELVVEGGCEGYCEPPRLEAACAADLYVECDGMCNASLDAECNASCQGDCTAECDVMPPEFDCFAYCKGECDASCEGKCEAGDGSAECRASCRATCAGECDAGCEGTPPSATCDARCEASCEGECRAEANIDCQGSCQADGFVECKAELEGGCMVQCQSPEGALFCDGQYVDASDIDACIQALRARLDIDIEAEGSADANCEGGICTATAEGSVSGCSAAPGSTPSGSLLLLGLLALSYLVPLRQRS